MSSSSNNYIPHNDAEFDNWFRNLVEYAVQKTSGGMPHGTSPEWDHIPQRHVEELTDAYKNWYINYTPIPPTPAAVMAKNDARTRAERIIRPFVLRFLHFEPVTHADRVNIALPLHHAIRIDHRVVEEEVDFALAIRDNRVVHVDFWVRGSDRKARPEGYDAILVWDILAHTAPVVLNRHALASKTPHAIEFPEEERGKTVYVALAWQNERGILGRWSELKSAVIP